MNGAEDGNLGEERSATDPDHTFPDTNGDGIHSALDILLIINELNEGMAAEGEAPVIADHTVGTNGSTREMWRPRNEQSSMAQVLPSVTRQPLQVQLAVSSLRQPSLDRLVNVEPYLVDLLAEDILSATL